MVYNKKQRAILKTIHSVKEGARMAKDKTLTSVRSVRNLLKGPAQRAKDRRRAETEKMRDDFYSGKLRPTSQSFHQQRKRDDDRSQQQQRMSFNAGKSRRFGQSQDNTGLSGRSQSQSGVESTRSPCTSVRSTLTQ